MKRKVQKENTRKHLLDIALKEFADKGLMSTKTAEVAHAAGLSHGALFVHFKTKEELLSTVIDQFGLQIGEKLQELTKHKGTPHEILGAHLKMIEEYESFYAHLVVEGPLLPSGLRNKIFMIQCGIGYYLEKSLSKHRKYPIHLLLNSWLGLVHYYLTHRDLFAPGKSVISTCGEELLDYFIKKHF